MKTIISLLSFFTFVTIPVSGQWIRTSMTPPDVEVTSFIISDSIIFAANGKWDPITKIYRSEDNGSTWFPSDNGLNLGPVTSFTKCIDTEGNKWVFAGGIFQKIMRSSNNGLNWFSSNGTATYCNALIAAPTGVLFAGMGLWGVSRSFDYGITWSGSTGPLLRNCFAITPGEEGQFNLFAGASDGIYLSADNGSSWMMSLDTSVCDIVVSSDSTLIFAASSGYDWFMGAGVFLSADNGATWNSVNNGLPSNLKVTSLCVKGNSIFAGTRHNGVFHSSDNGLLWQPINEGLENLSVTRLSVSPDGFSLLAGLSETGIWKRPFSQIITGIREFSLDKIFELDQNYPNPFNPATTITYSIPEHGKVRLTVYDALGREIKRLVDEEKTAGKHEIQFNSEDFASGIYFYRLNSGEKAISKKMIVVK